MASDFHEVRFPLDVSLGSRGGPVRRTDIVALASGREHRNSRWAQSRRRYDAGLGVRSIDALHAVITFFEERRGRLIGFRFRDRADWRSGAPSKEPTPLDQRIGTGEDHVVRSRQDLRSAYAPYRRLITKPVGTSVRVALDGIEQAVGSAFVGDPTTGIVTFANPPPPGAAVTAGFPAFDVPVRSIPTNSTSTVGLRGRRDSRRFHSWRWWCEGRMANGEWRVASGEGKVRQFRARFARARIHNRYTL